MVEVDGNIETTGTVVLNDDAEVDGDVKPDGDVVIRDDADGDGDARGNTVAVAGSAEIDGEITESTQ